MFNRVFNRGSHVKGHVGIEQPLLQHSALKQAPVQHSPLQQAPLQHSPLQQAPLQSQVGSAASQPINRRQGSVRLSNAFVETEMPIDAVGLTKVNNKYYSLSSRRFVSCENIRRPSQDDEEEGFQDVLDDDFDEDSRLKNKLRKHYSSITNVLMRSFRKAKSKKKKEATQQQQQQDPETPQSNELNEINNNNNNNNNSNTLPRTNGFRNEIVKGTLTRSNVKKIAEKNTPSAELYVHEQDSDDNKSSENEDDEEEDDGSAPVCVGVKMISNEFVDLKVSDKPNINIEPMPRTSKSVERNNLSLNRNNVANLNRVYSTLPVKVESSTLPRQSVKKIDKSDDKNESDVLLKFSSHMKPRAPKPPTEILSNPKPSNYETYMKIKTEEKLEEKKKSNDENHTEKQVDTKQATVKRSKTFTQQLQDMLTDRKSKLVQEPDENFDRISLNNVLLDERPNLMAHKEIYSSNFKDNSTHRSMKNLNFIDNHQTYTKLPNLEMRNNSFYETKKNSDYYDDFLSKEYQVHFLQQNSNYYDKFSQL